MSSPTTKTTQFKIIFVLYSLLLGLLIGGIAAAFLALINFSTHLIWQVGYSHFNQPFYPLLVGLFGGLLVGLMQRYWGPYPKTMHETLSEFKQTGSVAYQQQVGKNIIAALVVLSCGASLGPEAALSTIVGGLITWLGDRLKLTAQQKETFLTMGIGAMLAAIFHAPLAGVGEAIETTSLRDHFKSHFNQVLLYILTTATGILGFALVNQLFPKESPFTLHTPIIHWTLMVWPLLILALIVGLVFGNLFLKIEQWCQWLFDTIQRPVLLAMVAGVFLGACGLLSPYLLFSGEHYLFTFTKSGLDQSFIYLLLIGLGKTVLTNLLFAFGWRGGKIFPAIFASAAIGLSLAVVLPYTPGLLVATVVAVSCTVIVAQPYVTATLLLFLFPIQFFPVILLACLASHRIQKMLIK